MQLRPGVSTSLFTLTFVYLALHGNEVLSVTTETVNLDLETRQNIVCLPLPGCGALPQNGL